MSWLSKEIVLSLKTVEDPLVHQNPTPTPSKANSLKINSPLPVDFINRGNTCYANAILQILSALPLLWNRASSESPSLCPFLKLNTQNLKIKSRSKKAVHSSNFLWAITGSISGSCHEPFIFKSRC